MTSGHFTAILVAGFLAGCGDGGGATTGAPILEPVAANATALGQLPPGFSARLDAETGTLTLVEGTSSQVLQPGQAFVGSRFRFYRPDGGFAYAAGTASGAGQAGLVADFFDFAATFQARLSETRLPGGGTASFSGDYIGLVLPDATIVPDATLQPVPTLTLLVADAALQADFAAGIISGAITNRRFDDEVTFADVTLQAARISEGAFGGMTTGGGGTGSRTTVTAPGTYSGLFVGAEGQEIVGGVVIPHAEDGRALTELGAFVAERTAP